jgi:predicted nucleic acid-binding protein
VDKALLDSSTFFDVLKAAKHSHNPWALATIQNLVRYQSLHRTLSISAWTIFEHIDGLHRSAQPVLADAFMKTVVPTLEVIYPDENTFVLAARIHASLAVTGQTIGIVDPFIAATAITQDLDLVTANTKHFERIRAEGFALRIQNWREL